MTAPNVSSSFSHILYYLFAIEDQNCYIATKMQKVMRESTKSCKASGLDKDNFEGYHLGKVFIGSLIDCSRGWLLKELEIIIYLH